MRPWKSFLIGLAVGVACSGGVAVLVARLSAKGVDQAVRTADAIERTNTVILREVKTIEASIRADDRIRSLDLRSALGAYLSNE